MNADNPAPYPYSGPDDMREPVLAALSRVVDPEVAMTIVDVGLVYGVDVTPGRLHVLLTMTSAACPSPMSSSMTSRPNWSASRRRK